MPGRRPRLSHTASYADQWLPIVLLPRRRRPGTLASRRSPSTAPSATCVPSRRARV